MVSRGITMNKTSNHLNKGLSKLKEEQTKGYQICLENISKWRKFREDYEHLERRLETLAEKIDYDVMVPFGSVAFVPGKLIHTNEVTVLLGDNWFAERSAKQAGEIVSRRIAQCDNTLGQFEKERRQYEQWMLSTVKVQEEVGGDVLDIVEECDEDEERAWREEHRQNVKRYHQSKSADGSSLAREEETEEDYWQRLETSEAENDEILQAASEESDFSSSEEDETGSSDGGSSEETRSRRSVHWKEAASDILPEPTSSLPTVKINFSETKDPSASTSRESSVTTVIRSPSDIYEQFSAKWEPKPLKSILKSSSTQKVATDPPAIAALSDSDNAAVMQKSSDKGEIKAFTGVIVERDPQVSSQDSKDIDPSSTRKISKFKERQMKRI